MYELLSKAAIAHKGKNNNGQKELHFVFFRRPTRFLPSEDGVTVGAVQLEKTCLKGQMSETKYHIFADFFKHYSVGYIDDGVAGKQVAVGTGEFEDLKCG